MPLLRRSVDETKRIPLDEEGSYIEVTKEITKRQFNRIVDSMPQDVSGDITPSQGVKMQTVLFETFVQGWSLDTPPSAEEYLDLPREAADAIDTALMEHFSNDTQVGEPDQKKRRR